MTTLDPAIPYIRNPEMVAAEMDGDLVMMSIEQGEYYGVSGVGPRIWELLENPATLDQIVRLIGEEFDVDGATCRQDVMTFIQELTAMGLVQPVQGR